jgi:hypothetical protein
VPVHSVVFRTDSTADFQLISWNKACSVYSYTTFVKREQYLFSFTSEWDALRDWYGLDEDLEVRSFAERQALLAGTFDALTRRRRVGDQYTWVIALDTNGINPSLQPDAVLESTSFRSEIEQEHRLGGYYSLDDLHFRVLEHPMLVYSYATLGTCGYSDPCDCHCAKFKELLTYLDKQWCVELMKLPLDDRPPELEECMETFTKPPAWTYVSNEVIKRLKDLLDESDFEVQE